MRFDQPEAFRASLEARLGREASGSQRDLLRLRRTVAFDRFVARLAVYQPGAWVLKGGAALEFRMPDRARATRDIDLAFSGNESAEAATEHLIDAMGEDPFGDFFGFRVTRNRTLSIERGRGAVVRLSLDVSIGGRLFERLVVDVVSSEGKTLDVETVEVGHVVAFAGLPLVDVTVLDLRTHWAEKLSAYCRRFDDRDNTRVKDLVDLVLLIEYGLVPDESLHRTVLSTFASRNQQTPPAGLPSMADSWAVPFSELATDVGLTTRSSHEAHQIVQAFWRQVVDASPRAPD